MATKNTNAPIVNDTLIDWVIKEEGFLDKPTNIGDGKITLGSGLTAQKWRDKYRKNGNKWTKQDNRAAVREELESRKRWAEDTIPNWENLPDDTKRAMLSYKYNYDFTANNSPKLFEAMRSGDYIEAVRQMDATSKDPKFKKGLQERRNREQAWGLGALIGSNAPIYQEAPPIVEYPDNTRIFNPYTPLFEEVTARPALVPTNPTTNYVEARLAEPEEWQQDDALAAFRMLERAKNYRDSMLWENQPELPQIEYNPTKAPYLVTRYDEGGNIEKKKAWDELSVKEKADMMRVAVENGITSLSEIKDKYNEFAEGGNTEDDVVLPEQEGFIYKGPTYEEVKQQIDPLVYNEISKQAAMRNNPTKEIVSYRDINSNTQEALNTESGVLSPVDPIGEFIIADRMFSPLIKAAGRAMNKVVKPVIMKSSPETTLNTRPVVMNSLTSSTENSTFSPFKNTREGINAAREYKNSQEYKDLVQKAIEESKNIGTGDFTEDLFIGTGNKEFPTLSYVKRPKGSTAAYNKVTNTITIDPAQSKNYGLSGYHEGLHWQKVGDPKFVVEEYGPAYKEWIDAPSGSFRSDYWFDQFVHSPEYSKFKLRKNADNYITKKVEAALYDDADDYLRKFGELQVNGMTAGKAVGLEPFTPYPGYTEALTKIKEARAVNNYLYDVKAGTQEEVKNFWDILTGQYTPAVAIPIGINAGLHAKGNK